MKDKEIRDEDKLIWDKINHHSKQLKRVDKNTIILFSLVIIALVIAIAK